MYLKPLQLQKASILVLEENPFLRAGLVRLLTDAGYIVAEGMSGAPSATRADLVLAGIAPRQTPKKALPRLDHAVPMILLVDQCTWSGLDFLDAANEFGAAAVLPRPFSRSALLGLIAKVLSQPLHEAEDAEADFPGPAERPNFLDSPNLA
jgi:DNA-binding NtrC family response regulator